ncbi:hypothetical protein [Devosia enhydra]|uniref:hypothetical protein n=1 Tax=Devosia enhydra TaxID=665118 RepID=UPI001160CC5D|nr:hypothetical protein [Devosia enhydra]
MLLHYLRLAGEGEDVAFNLSTALCVLHEILKCRALPSLGTEDRDRLIDAIEAAQPEILSLFPRSAERALALRGLEATQGLISHWAETPMERARYSAEIRADMLALSRHLRNAAHNLCLLAEVSARAEFYQRNTLHAYATRGAA